MAESASISYVILTVYMVVISLYLLVLNLIDYVYVFVVWMRSKTAGVERAESLFTKTDNNWSSSIEITYQSRHAYYNM